MSHSPLDALYVAPAYLKVQCGTADHLPPDVQAMLQAAYSRTTKSITERIPTEAGQEDVLRAKLRQFYLGWNHKSVGQLGATTLWFEGISQLAAKAIEDTPLFNGQECSTRYIDFKNQPLESLGSEAVRLWQERWMQLYHQAVPLTLAELKLQFPFKAPELREDFPLPAGVTREQAQGDATTKAEGYWANTLKARAFDICRGLIPGGATTNVCFSGTFDALNDQFGPMLHHPSPEMRELAERAITQLQATYPDATDGVVKMRERFAYVNEDYFYAPTSAFWDKLAGDSYARPAPRLEQTSGYVTQALVDAIAARKRYQVLPRHLKNQIRLKMVDEIDFGSFRDLHRHRPGVCLMPLLTPVLGFHEWYLKELPPPIADAAQKLLQTQMAYFMGGGESIDGVVLQYALPMGLKVPVSYESDVGQFLYVVERRADKTVHQTLRQLCQRQAKFFTRRVSGQTYKPLDGMHVDYDEDNFTLRRGKQAGNEEVL